MKMKKPKPKPRRPFVLVTTQVMWVKGVKGLKKRRGKR